MLFFFYGTLVAGNANDAARRVHARLRALGRATVRGRLHAIGEDGGWYPALSEGEGVVQGQLYGALAAFDDADLAALDDYESADYERRETRFVDATGHEGQAQAYWWAGPLPAGVPAIVDGDFAGWLRRTGLPAYR